MAAAHPKNYCPVFGNYPKEYNRAVHGPFYPWVNYGPTKDVHFSEVKLGELKSYIARRNKTPQAMMAAVSRLKHLYGLKWFSTRYGSPTKGLFQSLIFIGFISMLGQYGHLKEHRNHKYHW